MSGVPQTRLTAPAATGFMAANLLQRVRVSPDAAEMMDRLGSGNPGTAIKACLEVEHIPMLTNALAMKWAYPKASWLARQAIDRWLFTPLLHREGADVNGQFSGITGLGTGRHHAIIAALRQYALPQVLYRFGKKGIRIRDEGISSGAVSMKVYLREIAQHPGVRYTASDLVSALYFVGNGNGVTAVFNDAPVSRISDNLLQVIREGWVDVQPDPEELAPFREAYKWVRGDLAPPMGFSVERISVQEPRVDALARKDPRFQVTQHDLFEELPREERAHLTIISNVLLPRPSYGSESGYYEHDEIREGLRSVGRSLVDGGMALIINEVPQMGRREGTLAYIFPLSVYERKGPALRLVDERHQGFLAKRATDLETVRL